MSAGFAGAFADDELGLILHVHDVISLGFVLFLLVFSVNHIDSFPSLLCGSVIDGRQRNLRHGSQRNIVKSADGIIGRYAIAMIEDGAHDAQSCHVVIADKSGGRRVFGQGLRSQVITVLVFGIFPRITVIRRLIWVTDVDVLHRKVMVAETLPYAFQSVYPSDFPGADRSRDVSNSGVPQRKKIFAKHISGFFTVQFNGIKVAGRRFISYGNDGNLPGQTVDFLDVMQRIEGNDPGKFRAGEKIQIGFFNKGVPESRDVHDRVAIVLRLFRNGMYHQGIISIGSERAQDDDGIG